jgi:hypothetical protein
MIDVASDTSGVPPAAKWLGLAGLLPTAAAAVFIWIGTAGQAALAFSASAIYGALILSFLGGAWWGLAAARASAERLPMLLVLSVIPSLIGWLALLVLSPAAIAVLGLCFGLALIVDRRLVTDACAPGWWWRLRFPLSATMAVLHALIAVAATMRGF